MNIDCNEISVIPQFGGTCWFNVILMSCFYSQRMRKLMINKISKTWKKESTFYKLLKTILKKNYNENKEIIKLFNKIKPELLLLKFLFENDKELLEYYKNNKKGIGCGGYIIYISKFLKKLNAKVLDITVLKNNKYLLNINDIYIKSYINNNNEIIIEDKKKEIEEINKIISNIPDILIINFEKKNYNDKLEIFNSENYNIKLDKENINNCNEYINFKGYKYKLDNIILSNYNKTYNNINHVISGITCNNKKYIYNGWQKNTNSIFNKYILIEPCKLQEFDWNINRSEIFVIKPYECKLIKYKYLIELKEKYAYSFNLSNKLLIYVRENKNKKISIKSLSISSLSDIKRILKNYYNVKNLKNINKIY